MHLQGKPVENRFDGISDEHITSQDPDVVSVSVSATFLYFKLNDIQDIRVRAIVNLTRSTNYNTPDFLPSSDSKWLYCHIGLKIAIQLLEIFVPDVKNKIWSHCTRTYQVMWSVMITVQANKLHSIRYWTSSFQELGATIHHSIPDWFTRIVQAFDKCGSKKCYICYSKKVQIKLFYSGIRIRIFSKCILRKRLLKRLSKRLSMLPSNRGISENVARLYNIHVLKSTNFTTNIALIVMYCLIYVYS